MPDPNGALVGPDDIVESQAFECATALYSDYSAARYIRETKDRSSDIIYISSAI
jgi:hypothetical protein